MHVGDILGFILGVIRVKNQLKAKYFTGVCQKKNLELYTGYPQKKDLLLACGRG